jgi:hypothetical protein
MVMRIIKCKISSKDCHTAKRSCIKNSFLIILPTDRVRVYFFKWNQSDFNKIINFNLLFLVWFDLKKFYKL